MDWLIPSLTIIVGLLGGTFGAKLLDRWFDRDKIRMARATDDGQRHFADNEQARQWLRDQLDERDDELRQVSERERDLLKQIADLAAKVARHEERANAQAIQIEDLRAAVDRWGAEYRDMKLERDQYRARKRDLEDRLAAETERASRAETERAALSSEVERLRGQIAMTSIEWEGHA